MTCFIAWWPVQIKYFLSRCGLRRRPRWRTPTGTSLMNPPARIEERCVATASPPAPIQFLLDCVAVHIVQKCLKSNHTVKYSNLMRLAANFPRAFYNGYQISSHIRRRIRARAQVQRFVQVYSVTCVAGANHVTSFRPWPLPSFHSLSLFLSFPTEPMSFKQGKVTITTTAAKRSRHPLTALTAPPPPRRPRLRCSIWASGTMPRTRRWSR